MTSDDWEVAFARALGVFLNGEGIASPGPRGETVVDDSYYLLFNAGFKPVDFTMPMGLRHEGWRRVLDTTRGFTDDTPNLSAGAGVIVDAHGIVLLERLRG
jgi:glycogen operon protein